jgi:trehalose/maltose hydrolase-like predicted phosphorylase
MKDPGAMDGALEATGDVAWTLEALGYDALRETSFESRFAISNGFIGVRGARAITRGAGGVDARTYVAGLFGTPDPKVISPGLVTAADWLQVGISLHDEPLVRHPVEATAHRRTLDFKRGALLSQSTLGLSNPHERTLGVHVRTLRLASQAARAVGLQLIELELLDGGIEVTFEASLDGADPGLVLERLDQDLGVWRAPCSGRRVGMATWSCLRIDGVEAPPSECGKLRRTWTWTSRAGVRVTFERLVALARSDGEDHEAGDDARARLGEATRLGWRGVLTAHEAAWSSRWLSSDVEVEGDDATQKALRFAVYHLGSAANPDDERVSIAARGLTGDDYRGHVFWDTEIYLLPFYTLTWPQAARSMLMYRFLTLDGARAKAAKMGWRGALYAWESADTGEEETPEEVVGPDRKIIPILSGRQEQHISADVAYAVWRYWQATADERFLIEAGAEILLETARFWASRALREADGRRHIRGVIGPDEYHEHVDDNAFTNMMARWNLARGIEVAALLLARWPDHWRALAARLEITDAEMADWSDAAQTIATGLDPDTGLFDQFQGFRDLDQIDLSDYDGRSVPMDVVLGRDRIQRVQVVKQADVVALLGLLPEAFVGDRAATNFHYYEPRCSHGSSLSRAMHGLVAARLGESELALDFFRQTAAIDLGDGHVAIDGGIHVAALGGLWLIAVLGFAGLSLTEGGLALDPRLPSQWRRMRFAVQWRGRCVNLTIEPEQRAVEATLTSGAPMTLTLPDQTRDLKSGETVRIPLPARGPPKRAMSTEILQPTT